VDHVKMETDPEQVEKPNPNKEDAEISDPMF
jgi:hypothetical protein